MRAALTPGSALVTLDLRANRLDAAAIAAIGRAARDAAAAAPSAPRSLRRVVVADNEMDDDARRAAAADLHALGVVLDA